MSAETKDVQPNVPSGFHSAVQEKIEWRRSSRHNFFMALPSVIQ
jgi:hypothetical protein